MNYFSGIHGCSQQKKSALYVLVLLVKETQSYLGIDRLQRLPNRPFASRGRRQDEEHRHGVAAQRVADDGPPWLGVQEMELLLGPAVEGPGSGAGERDLMWAGGGVLPSYSSSAAASATDLI